LGRPLEPLKLSEDERATLETIARRPKSSEKAVLRARIVLLCADGRDNGGVAEVLGVTRQTVGKWRDRFVAERLEGLLDEPRPGIHRAPSKDTVTKTPMFSEVEVAKRKSPRRPTAVPMANWGCSQ
jgi:hypothetical protein